MKVVACHHYLARRGPADLAFERDVALLEHLTGTSSSGSHSITATSAGGGGWDSFETRSGTANSARADRERQAVVQPVGPPSAWGLGGRGPYLHCATTACRSRNGTLTAVSTYSAVAGCQ